MNTSGLTSSRAKKERSRKSDIGNKCNKGKRDRGKFPKKFAAEGQLLNKQKGESL